MNPPITPAIYSTRIRHIRTEPLHNDFEYCSYSWFVDIEDLPVLAAWLRPFAQFRAADHFGDPTSQGTSFRTRIDMFLADNDIDIEGGRITALLNARVLGYVFNPLSLFWCHDSAGTVRCVVAEVHNTYGQRHSYVLRTDEAGRADTAKQFYVSPFNDVDGTYEMSLPEPGAQLGIRIVLRRDGQAPFIATMRGEGHPATRSNILRSQIRAPLGPLVVSARIRKQGIALWARGLPRVRRPKTAQLQEATL